jgi:Glycosyltransferase Family 4
LELETMADKHRPLRILMTNNSLAGRAGSELYIKDLAIELMKRGHFPMAYSQTHGEIAKELSAATIPVLSDLREVSVIPDVIHGQHHLETMTASLHFPQVPVVYTCHGWLPWEEWPPSYPNIMRYVAVDELCRERLLTTHAINENDISMIHNFVDLKRFKRVRDLPDKPQSALVLSNALPAVPEAIQKACNQLGIVRVDIAGAASGNALAAPEEILANYDIVFAKARAAIEAMSSGCAVIAMDYAHLGEMVNSNNLARMRSLNFGIRTLQAHLFNEENIAHEIQSYNADDARAVTGLMRSNASLEAAADRWIDTYRKAISKWHSTSGGIGDESKLAAASQYLRHLTPRVKMAEHHLRDSEKLEGQHNALVAEAERLSAEIFQQKQELDLLRLEQREFLSSSFGFTKKCMDGIKKWFN